EHLARKVPPLLIRGGSIGLLSVVAYGPVDACAHQGLEVDPVVVVKVRERGPVRALEIARQAAPVLRHLDCFLECLPVPEAKSNADHGLEMAHIDVVAMVGEKPGMALDE